MNPMFLTSIDIRKVRRLRDIVIPLSADQRRHLILTGKSGCGKTSVLEALADYLGSVVSDTFCEADLQHWTVGATGDFPSIDDLREKYKSGDLVLAYYKDTRRMEVEYSPHVEKIVLQPVYGISNGPGRLLGRYLTSQKARLTQIQDVLRDLYEDDSLTLEMDPDTFQFSICTEDREPFGFNDMSMGYSAFFAILSDLMLRMECKGSWDMEGIVLIDEVEAHCHPGLQKRVFPILTRLFPNVQFIVSVNSPFVLNSAADSVAYDLTHRILAADGLTNLPYEGVVEGWFRADRLSEELRQKYDRYCELASQDTLKGSDWAEIAELEFYLDNIPSYLAWDITTEYNRLKLEMECRLG